MNILAFQSDAVGTSNAQLVPVNSNPSNLCLKTIHIQPLHVQQLQSHNPTYHNYCHTNPSIICPTTNERQAQLQHAQPQPCGQFLQIHLAGPGETAIAYSSNSGNNNDMPNAVSNINISHQYNQQPNLSNPRMNPNSNLSEGSSISRQSNMTSPSSSSSLKEDSCSITFTSPENFSGSRVNIDPVSLKMDPPDANLIVFKPITSSSSSSSSPNQTLQLQSLKTKGFSCDVCHRTFSQKGNLKSHLMTHSGERPHKCQICGKNFTQKGNLDTHVRIHVKSKDHKCQYCDKSFVQRGNLKTHIRSIHTMEKPYSCSHCGKAFAQKSNMLTHFRTHDKSSNYACNVCGKTFTQKGNLKTHQQRHGQPTTAKLIQNL